MINPRATPGYGLCTSHPQNGGEMQGNLPHQQAVSTVYANATDVLMGYDQQQNGFGYGNGSSIGMHQIEIQTQTVWEFGFG